MQNLKKERDYLISKFGANYAEILGNNFVLSCREKFEIIINLLKVPKLDITS